MFGWFSRFQEIHIVSACVLTNLKSNQVMFYSKQNRSGKNLNIQSFLNLSFFFHFSTLFQVKNALSYHVYTQQQQAPEKKDFFSFSSGQIPSNPGFSAKSVPTTAQLTVLNIAFRGTQSGQIFAGMKS